jgi:hypothetical protein
MKKSQRTARIIACVLIAGLMNSVVAFSSAAQDSSKTASKTGVVVLKIKKDDNGKTTVIDTTFSFSTREGQKAFEEYMKQYEADAEKLSEELDNIEVIADLPDLPDSILSDSALKQLLHVGKDIRLPRFRWQCKPEGFNYDFDIECPHDLSLPPFQGYDDFEEELMPDHDMRVFHYNHKRQTLSDIIGDIPMDRVKSYSIKDTKHGKRIIVDIEDNPLIEKQDRVIIIHEPGKSTVHKKDHSGRQMKVIINSGDEGQTEPQEKQSETPHPGKQDKQDESNTKKSGF